MSLDRYKTAWVNKVALGINTNKVNLFDILNEYDTDNDGKY